MTDQTTTRRFEAIALPHLNAAYNLARWLTRNDRDAEDVVQEAFLRAFKFFASFRGENGRAWLLGIVRNTCYSWLRQNRRHELDAPFDEQLHSLVLPGHDRPDADPEAIAARHEDWQRLSQALEKLPLEFREVVVLRDLEDLSYKEIAEIAAIPIGTVMSRLARGRRLLAEHVGQAAQRGSCDGL